MPDVKKTFRFLALTSFLSPQHDVQCPCSAMPNMRGPNGGNASRERRGVEPVADRGTNNAAQGQIDPAAVGCGSASGHDNNEPVAIGLFTARPGLGAFSSKDVVSMASQRLHDGTQKLTVRSAAKPTFAGVDPYNTYIDRNSDDNVKDVTVATR